eukprot:Phypoly_transcript_11422.p1 GENE.Phypoly_transcript_11422~~Phypoly_transcript_11422.p1  ORF type:complete len:380 (+),score=38.01 Phypoly_transcript_11422:73-1212(+)
MAEDKPLPYWHSMHQTAIVTQVISLLGSATIIISFIVLKSRRNMYNYQILFINIADFFWVFWHLTNHIEALVHGHVTNNKHFCTALGAFTHMGIGWELMWLMCVASYSAFLIYRVSRPTPSMWKPPQKLKIAVFCICWGFPMIWWLVMGISTDGYASTGYYCWVRIDEQATFRPWLLADGPLFVSFVYIVVCYSFVVVTLLRIGALRKRLTGHSYSSEVRKYILYIVVYTLWVHPYVIISLMQVTNYPKTKTYYYFWLYFLAMTNSLGTLNFIAYGYSEGWYRAWRGKLEDVLSKGSDSGEHHHSHHSHHSHYSHSPKNSKDEKHSKDPEKNSKDAKDEKRSKRDSPEQQFSPTASISASAMEMGRDSLSVGDSVDESV